MEDRGLEQPGGLAQQRVGVPGEDPRVQPAVRAVGHPVAGEVGQQRPAHRRHRGEVAGHRPRDLARGDRARHGQRQRPVPGQREDEAGARRRPGRSARTSVSRHRQPPARRRAAAAGSSRRIRAGPSSPAGAAGPARCAAGSRRAGASPAGEADVRARRQRIRLGRAQDGASVDVHLHGAAPRGPEPVPPRLAAPRADPTSGSSTCADGVDAEVAADDVDGAGRQRGQRPRRPLDRRGQPRASPRRHHDAASAAANAHAASAHGRTRRGRRSRAVRAARIASARAGTASGSARTSSGASACTGGQRHQARTRRKTQTARPPRAAADSQRVNADRSRRRSGLGGGGEAAVLAEELDRDGQPDARPGPCSARRTPARRGRTTSPPRTRRPRRARRRGARRTCPPPAWPCTSRRASVGSHNICLAVFMIE